MRKLALGLAALLSTLTLAETRAEAFCGFYVAGAEAKLFADATQVVLMREGTKTVLSMQNDYKGPPEKFAMVIPVPVVLQKEQVKILPREIFDKVDKLGAPRLVEYWEQDPCQSGNMWGDQIGNSFGAGGLGLSGIGEGGGGRDLGVKIEAKFAVGEYEIVILSAKDSGGLETWLKEEKYEIPSGAEPFLKPYVQKGMKFFVAKVDPAKVKFEGGHASLSPIRFHYDADTFNLPVRLGLINSSGTQDLVVNIVAKATRYEAANYPNVTIPTNLDVAEEARGRFGELYAALYDRTLEKNPKAVVTEYSWDAGTCDPCPGPTLDANDLATLGADVLPHGTDGLSMRGGGLSLGTIGTIGSGRPVPKLSQGPTKVTGAGRLPPEVIQRVVRQNFGRFRLCYETALRSAPTVAGTMVMSFTIDKTGTVSKVTAGGDIKDAVMKTCVTHGFSSLSFPAPEGGDAQVSYTITFAPPDPFDASAPPPSPPPVFSSPSPYVLTRLHVRYSKDALGDDLVFKVAPAISGGREVGDVNGREQGSKPATTNNFQARYAIRHPWKGDIACKEPRRGNWGGPPAAGWGRSPIDEAGTPSVAPGVVAADKNAFVPRGKIALGSMITGGESALGNLANAGGTTPPPPSSSDADAGATDGGSTSTTPPKGGCAGCAISTRETSRGGALAFLAALAVVARRVSSRSRKNSS